MRGHKTLFSLFGLVFPTQPLRPTPRLARAGRDARPRALKRRFECETFSLALAALLCLGGPVGLGQTVTPVPASGSGELPGVSDAIGLVQGRWESAGWLLQSNLGTGGAVRNRRVVITAAHVPYDGARGWATSARFFPQWNENRPPEEAEGPARALELRGGFFLAGYAGGETAEALERDFIAYYTYEDAARGGFALAWPAARAGEVLGSARAKTVYGYPFGASNDFRLGRTGPFAQAYAMLFAGFPGHLGVKDVTMGPGNSGGPVFVLDDAGEYRVAAVHVARVRFVDEGRDGSGARVLAADAMGLLEQAIEATGNHDDQPPEITRMPESVLAATGGAARFSVQAKGWRLNYQWRFRGADLPNATSPVLTLEALRATDAGTYTVAVSNRFGSVTSAPVTLTVLDPPVITHQPEGRLAPVGGSVRLEIGASGSAPLMYQWFFEGQSLGGATNATLELSNLTVQNAGTYFAVVFNAVGAVASVMVVLEVHGPPVIITQPRSQTALAGSIVTLAVEARSPLAPTYQWWHDSQSIANATAPVLVLTDVKNTDAGYYTVEVRNAAGSVFSDEVAVNVLGVRPALSQPVLGPAGFGLRLETVRNVRYLFEFTASLGAPEWTPLREWTGDGSVQVLTDSQARAPQRFYRVRAL